MENYPHLYQPPYRQGQRFSFGRSLRFHEQRVYESVPECLLIVDSDGDIVCTNAEMERLFGFQPHEVVGGPIELLIADGQREAYTRQLQRFLESNSPTPQYFELRGLHKEGRDFPMEIRLGLLKKEHEVFIVNSFHDLTALAGGSHRSASPTSSPAGESADEDPGSRDRACLSQLSRGNLGGTRGLEGL